MEKKLYKTKNIFIASFILATHQVEFLGLETLDSKTKLFTFNPYDVAYKLENEYLSGEGISAKDLFAEYNNLRSLIFDKDKNY
jgi:hypothetical protein